MTSFVRSRCPAVLFALLAMTMSARAARADGADPAAADQLFRQAQREVEQGHFDTACPKFAESQRLDPAAGTLLNLADCEEHVGQLANAWQHWHEGLDQLPKGDDRTAFAKQRITALEPRMPWLTIKLRAGSPPGARVKRDDVELSGPSLGAALPVNPGEHVIVVEAPGRAASRQTVQIAERDHKQIDVAVGAASPGAEQAGSSSGPADAPSGANGRRTVGFVVAGLGVVGLAAAGITGGIILSDKSKVDGSCTNGQCDQGGLDAYNQGKGLLAVNAIAWGVGVVGLGTGIVLIATSGGGESKARSVTIGARPVAAGASIDLGGRF